MTTATKKYAKVEIKTFKIDDLEESPFNARTIAAEAMKGLTASLKQFGVLALPIVNTKGKKPRIVGGHQRIDILRQQGVEEIACVVVEFDAATERRANFILNSHHITGEFVPELVHELVAQVKAALPDASTLRSLRLDVLSRQVTRTAAQVIADRNVTEGFTDADAIPSITTKTKPCSKVGRTYALGDHHIRCGELSSESTMLDFTVDAADVAFTYLASKKKNSNLAPDYVGLHLQFLLDNTNGPIHIATRFSDLLFIQREFVARNGYWSNTLICYDPDGVPVATNPYTDVTMPILYGWRDGSVHPFYAGQDQGNSWPVASTTKLATDVVVRALLNTTKADDVVLDTRVANGTTLIACQKTGRRLIGYAASPREMDRVARRWVGFTEGPDSDWRSALVEVS